MDFVKKVLSTLCLDSYNVDTLEFDSTHSDNSTTLVSDPSYTPRLASSFHKKDKKKTLHKYPSLTLSSEDCIKKRSLSLLKDYLESYNPDNPLLGPQQKNSIIMMLTVLLQDKKNFAEIDKLIPAQYKQKCKTEDFYERTFGPGKSEIFAYVMAVHQTQLKYIKPQPIQLCMNTTNHTERPISIKLERTSQEKILGPKLASHILQFLGNNFNYKFTNRLPCHRYAMRRRRLRPQALLPIVEKRDTQALIRDLTEEK